MNDWAKKRVVVIGGGRSGVAAAHLLLDLQATVTLTDLQPADRLDGAVELAERGAELRCGGHPDDLWEAAERAVLSPGISRDAAVVRAAEARNVPVVAEIELAAPFLDAPVVAITGSNGKSTVTSMVGAVLEADGRNCAVCGNIGLPLSQAVRRQIEGAARWDAWSVELSSFQTEEIVDFHPDVSVLLNITPDHLDRHGTLEAYAAAKMRLLHNCTDEDWLIYNADDSTLTRSLPDTPARRATFSLGRRRRRPSAWIEGDTLHWRDPDGAEERIVALDELRVIGPHNAANAAAATAATALLGVEPETIAAGLRAFRGLPHRMEDCGMVRGIRCVNDSKATNVDATIAALTGFDGGVWLILGGRDKGADFSQLAPLLADRVEALLLIGEAADKIEAEIGGIVPVERAKTLESAVLYGLSTAHPGDVLLLSPACTSFDQFDDFVARGDRFRKLVAAHRPEDKSGPRGATGDSA